MIAKRAFMQQRIRFSVPDFAEQRGQDHLLIWRDSPRWAVIDADLYELLRELDGRLALRDVIATQPQWIRTQKDARVALKRLLAQGMVENMDLPAATVASEDQQVAAIENVAVNITRRCNLNCSFCYNLGKPVTSREVELSVSEVASFLKSVQGSLAPKPTLMLLGGEPLLVAEKVLAVAKAAGDLGIQVLVSTNGTLVTDDFARGARKTRLHVQVSLDGDKAALHDAVRGKGAFDRTIRGIKVLLRHKTYVILSMVCHEGNMSCLEDYYQLATELGVREARFIPLKRIGGAMEGTFRPVDRLFFSTRTERFIRV